MGSFIWMCHFWTCSWYAFISDSDSEWYPYLAEYHVPEERLPVNWYGTGFYWTISTMLSGASYVEPKSMADKVFCALSVIVGFLIASLVCAIVMSDLMELRRETQLEREQMVALKMYL